MESTVTLQSLQEQLNRIEVLTLLSAKEALKQVKFKPNKSTHYEISYSNRSGR